MATLAWSRTTEITDALVDLFIGLVSKINTRAERKVDKAIELEVPASRVEDCDLSGGARRLKTLVSLLHEFKAKGTSYRQHKQRVFKASYTNHYRTGLIQIIEVLEFGSARRRCDACGIDVPGRQPASSAVAGVRHDGGRLGGSG
jgi:hypothetical protein